MRPTQALLPGLYQNIISDKIVTMEVHAHTHTPRKKWTHYLWEFLMLFLAVFCGFLAEYALEHKIEKDREKQFIQTMVADLKSDTTQIAEIISYEYRREIMVDSLIELLSSSCLLYTSPSPRDRQK